MKMVGHKTEAMYRRYAIADERRLREGADMPLEGRSVADVGEAMETRMVGRDGIEPPTPGFFSRYRGGGPCTTIVRHC